MDRLAKILATVGTVAKSVGGVIDAAVPAGVGSRTSYVVLACAALQYGGPFVPPPYAAIVPVLQSLLCAAAGPLAFAHVVR